MSMLFRNHAVLPHFLVDPRVPNTKFSRFDSMSCDDDGPVGQTGSEAALKTGERRNEGTTVVN